METEQPPFWTRRLPIIGENANFPKDTDSTAQCQSCETVCCFLRTMNFLGSADVKITLDGLKKYYKNFVAVENNFKEIFGNYSEDTISWKMYLVGNSNWKRTFKAKDGTYVDGYACIMLNDNVRCSIYPNRPECCREFGNAERDNRYFCDLKAVIDIKYGKKIKIKPALTHLKNRIIN